MSGFGRVHDNRGFDCTIMQRARDGAIELLIYHYFLASDARFSRHGNLKFNRKQTTFTTQISLCPNIIQVDRFKAGRKGAVIIIKLGIYLLRQQ